MHQCTIMYNNTLLQILKAVNSPYGTVADQLAAGCIKVAKEAYKYALDKMRPIVTYDHNMVCRYENDERFYYIDEDEVYEVRPTMLLQYGDNYQCHRNNGTVISDDELDTFHVNSCCGELDDMSGFIYFSRVERQTIEITQEEADKIHNYINVGGLSYCKAVTHSAEFDDGFIMEIGCAGEDDDPAWTQAVLWDANSDECECSNASSFYTGEWTLEHGSTIYIVDVVVGNVENGSVAKEEL